MCASKYFYLSASAWPHGCFVEMNHPSSHERGWYAQSDPTDENSLPVWHDELGHMTSKFELNGIFQSKCTFWLRPPVLLSSIKGLFIFTPLSLPSCITRFGLDLIANMTAITPNPTSTNKRTRRNSFGICIQWFLSIWIVARRDFNFKT